MKINKKNLIWIDLEMTGLDPKTHRIIEIATLITDDQLNIVSEGPVISIYQKNKYISLMDKWNTTTHQKSGLIKRVKKSLYNENQAEIETLLFLKKWVPIKTSPMCGNSISQDRRFLFKYMPKLENYFHYRNIDVSSIKELIHRWYNNVYDHLKKRNHTALEDVRESVMELKFYKENFFKFE
ncbi:oligoribonuclease [Buchnera aphidicola]|uniref:Oligoribonuclease n=1 Tax=Buchnera aphidicola (Lipaphis pseudobrassicae) TaxID=1258543 RepID=A0A4D6Y821_9GAMM|nr:oligoribonuclease [Buchnera aphidicola]QCI22394.1 oligoribonuclease [Buchnera aphidicola (Lipaphis pseudobrassicae)]